MTKKLLFVSLLSLSQLSFADDLSSVYQQALRSDPNLAAARLQVELSESQQAQAGGALLPQVSASVNISYNNRNIESQVGGDTEYMGQRYSVSLTQPIIDVAKFYNWQRYQSLTSKSTADFQQAQQVLLYDVTERYFQVLAAQDSLELVNQETSTTEKQLEQFRQQYAKQLIKITDIYELEAKLDALVAEKIEVETQIDIAKQGLMELTGTPLNTLATLRNDIKFQLLSGDAKTVAIQAQQSSPLILAEQQAVEAADNDLISQHARHLPSVDLQLQYYNTDNGFQNSQTPVIDTKVAAINVTIPLFSGGSTYQRAAEAAKQLEISKQRKISLLRSVEKETRDAFLSANASVRRIAASEKALKTATKAREAMEKGFKFGMQSIGDVLVSQAREYSARKDLRDVKYTYILNRIRFQRAIGTLNHQSLDEINQWLVHK